MSQTVFGAAAVVTILNRAFNNSSPAAAVFNNQVSQAGTTAASEFAFANTFGSSFAGLTDAQLSTRVLGNMGLLPNPDLEQALADYFGSVNPADRGTVVLQLGQILSTLETAPAPQDIFNAAAMAWNKEVEQSYIYSSNTANTTPFDGDFSNVDTFTLTRFTDVKTAANFNGFLDYNQFTGNDEQTLTTGDRLTGTAADTDTLFAQLQGVGTRPKISGVETISIDAKAAVVGLDMSDVTGAKTIVNKGSNELAALSFTAVNSLVNVAIQNTNSDTTVAFAPSVVAGAADNLNLTVTGAGIAADRANFTVAGIESLTVNAAGAASMLGTVAAAISKLTITGDQNLSVGTKAGGGFTSAALSTVDASAATGNLFLNIAASGAATQTVTTGTGNDTVVASGLSALDTFTLGTGTDRLVVADAGTNQAVKLVGVEQVEARVAGTNLNLTQAADVNLIAIAEGASIANATAVKSGNTFAYEGVGGANAVPGATPTFGNVQFNLANATGSTDVVNVTFGNNGVALGANNVVNMGWIWSPSANVETYNFNFSDVGATNTVNQGDIYGGLGARALNFTSDSKVTIANTGGTTSMTGLTSVDATGVKGAFTATFGALADAASAMVKTGGSGNNNVTVAKGNLDGAAGTTLTVDGSAGTGSQTFTVNNTDADITGTTASFVFMGGSGADTLALTSAAGSLNVISAAAGTDSISLAASAGVDRLMLNLGDTGSTVATADNVTGFATTVDKIDVRSFGFDLALQGANVTAAQLNGTAAEFGGLAAHISVVGGNSTVYVDTNGDNKLGAGDLVVNLIGTVAVAGDIAFV